MITEHDLQEAIAECQGVRNPDAKTCMMLAAFYTLKDRLFPEKSDGLYNIGKELEYSYDEPPNKAIIYNSGTEFGEAINGKDIDEVLGILDEAMDAISVLNPSLYRGIMRKIKY